MRVGSAEAVGWAKEEVTESTWDEDAGLESWREWSRESVGAAGPDGFAGACRGVGAAELAEECDFDWAVESINFDLFFLLSYLFRKDEQEYVGF